MTPRIITAEEARTLREAATPGPWSHSADGYVWGAPPEPISCAVWNADAAITAAAPDLAATVEALHAEVERLRTSMQRISGVVAAVAGVLDYAHETATRDDIDFDDMVVSKLVLSIEPYSHGGWKKKAEALRAMLAEVTP
jgi:hypothetical protein